MGVPGWRLHIVMGFLKNRVMVVRYKGHTSETKTFLLGVLRGPCLVYYPKKKFIPSSLHTKYVDDLTIGEAFNIKYSLIPNPDRPLPDTFHCRL